MKDAWIKARSDFENENLILLPKNLYNEYGKLVQFEDWLDEKLKNSGQNYLSLVTKGELKQRGWTPKIILHFELKPDRKVFLGRGMYVYYYYVSKLEEIEVEEEFYLLKSKKKKNKDDGNALIQKKLKSDLSQFKLI